MKKSYIFFSLVFSLCPFSSPAFGLVDWAEDQLKKGGKAIGDAASDTGKAIGDTAKKGGKAIEKGGKVIVGGITGNAWRLKVLGDQISKLGGKVVDIGVKVGNITVVNLSKAGEVTLNVAGKAGTVVLKTGQRVVNSSGMTLLNAGGMVLALSQGDLAAFKECAGAIESGARLTVSTAVNETLKTAGNIDKLIQINTVSIEASSAQLALQGKTPKVSISGSFFSRNFNLKDVQLDLSSPHKFVADLIEELFKL